MAKKVLRGGVFGFGGMGQGMTKNINFDNWYGDEFRIVGACNRGESKRTLAEKEYGLKAFEDPRDLIAMGLDFGLVTSTTVAHCEHVCLLAEAGIPMLAEKPIALTLEEGRKMVDAVKKAGVASVVNFGPRMDSCNKKIKAMIDEGLFGRLMSFVSFVNRGHGFYSEGARHRAVIEPEESGGWTVHHACHQIDLAVWLMGAVDAVSTVSLSTAEGIESAPGLLSEEAVLGRLHFSNGAVGSIFDCAGGVRDTHLNIVGTTCSVGRVEAAGTTLLKCKMQGDAEWGAPRIIDPRREYPHEDNLKRFLNIVRDGGDSNVTVADAFYSLRVAFAMRESARKGGEVVRIDATR